MTVVDRSLSRGLADKFLAEIHERENKHLRRRESLLIQRLAKRADVRRITNALIDVGEECFFTQIFASHPRWRWAVISAFVPTVMTLPSLGVHHRILSFSLLRISIHVGRFADVGPGLQLHLAISEHAIERLFQRMNVVSSDAVEDELHEAMCMSVPALSVCNRLNLQQIVLPTKSGMFLCEFSASYTFIIAKTWIANTPETSRNSDAAQSLKCLYIAIGGKPAVAEFLATLPVSATHCNMPLPDKSVKTFQKNDWLKEAYSPRADPVGDVWRLASAQAGQASDK